MSTLRAASCLAASLAVLGALTACGGPDHGIVHSKSYSAAWVQPITTCSAKPVICTTTPIYHPESWSLDIYASTDNHGWVNVSEKVYDSVHIGDEWSRD